MSTILPRRLLRSPLWVRASKAFAQPPTPLRAPTQASAAAAALGLGAAASLGLASPGKSLSLEEQPAYAPPPRFSGSFGRLPANPPVDEAGQLAWAVKHMEVDRVRSALKKWPQGAALVDKEDNTLFHLAASEPERCAARPEAAAEVVAMLLRGGWLVVDQKNCRGERAEIVAARMDAEGPARQLLVSRSSSFSEQLRTEDPMQLLGDLSPKPWEWEYPVQDEQRRSFAGVNLRAFPEEKCREWMQTLLEKAHWSDIPDVPRKVAWYVSKECADCPYRYSGLEYPATVFPPFMEEIREELCKLCGIPEGEYPNSCNVNVYNDHTQEVGWHSDDEVMFQGLAGDTRIISFSLGAPRHFCWRLQGTTQTLGSVSLGDGDVMTMEGLFQKHYKHSVPESSTPCGKRINMTFRWIKVKAHALDAGVKAVQK